MPALAVIPFVLLLQTLISIPNSDTFILRDELNIDNTFFVNDTGPALFKRKLTGIASKKIAILHSYFNTVYTLYCGLECLLPAASIKLKRASLCIGPLYAELAEGVMSYRVKLYHEHELEKVYYYTEDCNGDLEVATVSPSLHATIIIIMLMFYIIKLVIWLTFFSLSLNYRADNWQPHS